MMKTLNINNLTISGRIVVFTISLVMVTTIVLSLIFVQTEQVAFQSGLEDQATTLLNTLNFAADNDLTSLNIATLQNLADELSNSGVIVRFYLSDGRLVASNATGETNLYYFEPDINGLKYIDLDQPQLDWQPDLLVGAQSITIGDQVVGAVSLELSTNQLQQQIIEIQNQTLLILILTVILGGVVSLLIGRSITNPITNLIDATERISTGIYENRIQLEGETTPEIKKLVSAFDTLINKTIEQRTTDIEAVANRERENSRLKDEFIAVMSHELRTPLNAIIGFLGIIKIKGNLDEKNQHRLNRARANAERLLALINDILDISRIEAGRVEVIQAPINVDQFFDTVKSQMIILAEEKKLDFHVNINPEMPPIILSDEGLLTKIVINLLGNAFKFTDKGHVSLQVNKKTKDWEISVTDTGIGIPYHMQDSIFQRFRQVDGSSKRKHDGTGLGLAIVSSLVKELEGTLTLQSEPGKGSTFTVTLPIQEFETKVLMEEV